jgi:uncharacterized protein YraI
MKYIAMICLLALAGCSNEPSCEERGGVEVRTGFITTYSMVGNVPVPIFIPRYTCMKEGSVL